MMVARRHTPKPCIKSAILRLGLLVSAIKQDLPEDELAELRKMYMKAYNCNDPKVLKKMVSFLNNRKGTTGSSFQLLTVFTHEHGAELEVREDRF